MGSQQQGIGKLQLGVSVEPRQHEPERTRLFRQRRLEQFPGQLLLAETIAGGRRQADQADTGTPFVAQAAGDERILASAPRSGRQRSVIGQCTPVLHARIRR